MTEQPLLEAEALRDLWETDLELEAPADAGSGAGAEAQLARAMQGAAIPIIETPPERTWIWSDLHLDDRSVLFRTGTGRSPTSSR